MNDAEHLARLRVAAMTGRLPPDLGKWALQLCESRVASVERRALRNEMLRQAATVHGGSRYAAARDIRQALQLFRDNPARGGLQDFAVASFLTYVQRAWQVDPERPATLRQLLVVLG